VELLQVGDYVKVVNGQMIPIDGVVSDGNGLANESMLTGEEKPV
jgi:P-type E1-E2 ATPase